MYSVIAFTALCRRRALHQVPLSSHVIRVMYHSPFPFKGRPFHVRTQSVLVTSRSQLVKIRMNVESTLIPAVDPTRHERGR